MENKKIYIILYFIVIITSILLVGNYYYYILYGKDYGYFYFIILFSALVINCLFLSTSNSKRKVLLYIFFIYSVGFIISFCLTILMSKHGCSSFSDPFGQMIILIDFMMGVLIALFAFGFSIVISKIWVVLTKK